MLIINITDSNEIISPSGTSVCVSRAMETMRAKRSTQNSESIAQTTLVQITNHPRGSKPFHAANVQSVTAEPSGHSIETVGVVGPFQLEYVLKNTSAR